jgi:ubiquinone/menaquinone biosynthesis C-methylase UbiE
MGRRLEKYFNNNKNKSKSMYGDLAELYDFVYERHYDYEKQLRLIQRYSNEESSVLEGACGTGRLSKQLENSYKDVFSFDLNSSMLRVARNNNPVINFEQHNMLDLQIEKRFNTYAVLGNSIIHLKDQEFKEFVSEAYGVLEENGKLIFDYIPVNGLENGYFGSKCFESEIYNVRRSTITTKKSNTTCVMSFSFEITDKEKNKSTTTGESLEGNLYYDEEVKEILENKGFSEVEIEDHSDTEGATIEDRVAIAKK